MKYIVRFGEGSWGSQLCKKKWSLSNGCQVTVIMQAQDQVWETVLMMGIFSEKCVLRWFCEYHRVLSFPKDFCHMRSIYHYWNILVWPMTEFGGSNKYCMLHMEHFIFTWLWHSHTLDVNGSEESGKKRCLSRMQKRRYKFVTTILKYIESCHVKDTMDR